MENAKTGLNKRYALTRSYATAIIGTRIVTPDGGARVRFRRVERPVRCRTLGQIWVKCRHSSITETRAISANQLIRTDARSHRVWLRLIVMRTRGIG